MNLPSKFIEEAVEQLSSLPGIGKKTALRLVLNMLKRQPEEIERFSAAFVNMKRNIRHCKVCHNISDYEVCTICSNPARNKKLVCVVEDIRDVMAIENTQQYKGIYHVLGGIISPMDGIGPGDLTIQSLVDKVRSGVVEEIILALSATMEGDTTNFFIFKKLKEFDIAVSTISRGVAIGDELEYADEVTLGRSIVNRTPYENSLVK
jgi:recombination protein RecR